MFRRRFSAIIAWMLPASTFARCRPYRESTAGLSSTPAGVSAASSALWLARSGQSNSSSCLQAQGRYFPVKPRSLRNGAAGNSSGQATAICACIALKVRHASRHARRKRWNWLIRRQKRTGETRKLHSIFCCKLVSAVKGTNGNVALLRSFSAR